eukprot:3346335-Rhodomonas_salina.1
MHPSQKFTMHAQFSSTLWAFSWKQIAHSDIAAADELGHPRPFICMGCVTRSTRDAVQCQQYHQDYWLNLWPAQATDSASSL